MYGLNTTLSVGTLITHVIKDLEGSHIKNYSNNPNSEHISTKKTSEYQTFAYLVFRYLTINRKCQKIGPKLRHFKSIFQMPFKNVAISPVF